MKKLLFILFFLLVACGGETPIPYVYDVVCYSAGVEVYHQELIYRTENYHDQPIWGYYTRSGHRVEITFEDCIYTELKEYVEE